MLISFKVSNSRSIGAELEFSAIATDDTALPENTIDLPQYGIKLLKTMAIFGANASGKTNILKALADAIRTITHLNYEKSSLTYQYNKNDNTNKEKAICYEFIILVNGTLYNYSFHNDKYKVHYEVLKNIEKNEVIYERIYDSVNNLYTWRSDDFSFFEQKNNYFFQELTSEHNLFMTVANTPFNNQIIYENEILKNIYSFFLSFLFGINKEISPDKLIRYLMDFDKSKILKYIQYADTSITNISVEKVNNIIDFVGKDYESSRNIHFIRKDNGEDILVQIRTKHRNTSKNVSNEYSFDFFLEESEGTKLFIIFLGSVLYELEKNKKSQIFIVDELDASLHPKLTLFLMRLFAHKETNPYNSQLIFTTHEVKLMDRTIMRPDQLYLVNKDQNGDTTIERMSDYSGDLEKYTRFDTLYMNGGMSGIPNISLL